MLDPAADDVLTVHSGRNLQRLQDVITTEEAKPSIIFISVKFSLLKNMHSAERYGEDSVHVPEIYSSSFIART